MAARNAAGDVMSQSQTPEEIRYLGLTPTQLNLAFFSVLGAIGLAVFLYLGGLGIVGDALSGGGSEPADSAASEPLTPTPDAPNTISDADVARSAVLTLDDMPIGWTKDVDEDEDDDDEDYNTECIDQDKLDNPPGEIASATSEDFEGPENQSASNEVTVFEDEETAAAGMALITDMMTRCRDEFLALVVRGAKEGLAEEGQPETKVEARWATPTEIAFETESASYRFVLETTIEGVDLVFTFDFRFVRSGRLVGSYMYMAINGMDTFEEQAIGLTAADKLRDAGAALAQ